MFFNKKRITVIDASKGMANLITALIQNYTCVCKYREILQISESERLDILKWIWERWEEHMSKKQLKQTFPNYPIDILYNIFLTENARIYMYYHQQEFIKYFGNNNPRPLIYIKYFDFLYHKYLCKMEDIPDVFNYLIENNELDIEVTQAPTFAVAPSECFLDENDYEYLYFWDMIEFIKLTPKQLREYCQKNKLAYPFKN